MRRLVGGLSAVVILTAVWVGMTPFPLEALEPGALTSTRIVGRDGTLFREVLSSEETRGQWVHLDEVSDLLELATVQAEDRRFYDHAGIDFFAIVRSLWINVSAGSARTGASTITQQVVKLTVQRDEPRALGTKLMEAVWAWRLELALDKRQILEQYLNRIPYGNQLIGIEAASRIYFGKPPAVLSLAEAAFLAGLPSSPTRLNPYRHMDRALARQRWLLDLMHERGAIDELAWRVARAEALVIRPRGGPMLAPHLTSAIAAEVTRLPQTERPASLTLTLDPALQRRVEDVVARHQPRAEQQARPDELQASVVVLDTRTSEVLAWVGSRDFGDAQALGENDGVRAPRQPGSALKPFIYGLWFERGGTPEGQLMDVPRVFATATGPYRPENYDRHFRGAVTARTSLASSLNVPAVDVLEQVGVGAFVDWLRGVGLTTLTATPDHYGPGLALGNAEVRLHELAGAYATLGRLGEYRPVTWRRDEVTAEPRRVMTRAAALAVLDVLSDDRARGIGFGLAGPFELPYRVAAKTGTSSDFRDNWAFAVTPLHTVAVWVGHFTGTPMGRSPGRFGAAPLAREVLHVLYPGADERGDVPWFSASELPRRPPPASTAASSRPQKTADNLR